MDSKKRAINVKVPTYLHTMLKKLSADTEMSCTEILVYCLKQINNTYYKTKAALRANEKIRFSVEKEQE